MQQSDNTLALKTWRGYAGVVKSAAFDFELAVTVGQECDRYRDKVNGLSFMINSVKRNGLDCAVTYCNRTGQPIGVNFVDEDAPEYSSSIASQWLKTGPSALAAHVKNTPVAYTVYLVNKTLPAVESIADVNQRVTMLAGLYAVLASGDSSSAQHETAGLISTLQTALYVNSKLGKVNVNHGFGMLYRANVRDLLTLCGALADRFNGYDETGNEFSTLFKRGLNIWVANVMGRLVNKPLVTNGDNIAAFEWAEAQIANALRDIGNAVTAGKTTIDVGLTEHAAFSNLPQERKSKQSGYGKSIRRKAETERNAAALGNIFG